MILNSVGSNPVDEFEVQKFLESWGGFEGSEEGFEFPF